MGMLASFTVFATTARADSLRVERLRRGFTNLFSPDPFPRTGACGISSGTRRHQVPIGRVTAEPIQSV